MQKITQLTRAKVSKRTGSECQLLNTMLFPWMSLPHPVRVQLKAMHAQGSRSSREDGWVSPQCLGLKKKLMTPR